MRDEDQESIEAAHEALVAEGVIEPLSMDGDETRGWLDCELASLVENRFFVDLDPVSMGHAERGKWELCASSDEPLSSPHGHAWYRRAYWLLDGGDRVGTMALATTYTSPGLVTVSSLYVLRAHRRRGIAARALRKAHDAVKAHGGRGVRLPAYWTWQPAVRFYLGLGMWVLSWKHALVFGWEDALPPHRIEVGDREACFSIVSEGVDVPLIRATRDDDRLGWTELPALRQDRSITHAKETFAVALGTRGFPLVRSAAAWARRLRSSDAGDPEGLAHKIEVWEAEDRGQGYDVRTPRIPGLAYAPSDEVVDDRD